MEDTDKKDLPVTGRSSCQDLGHAVKTMFEAGLSPEEVMNLVPARPIGEEEANIRSVYRSKLTALYQKLKS